MTVSLTVVTKSRNPSTVLVLSGPLGSSPNNNVRKNDNADDSFLLQYLILQVQHGWLLDWTKLSSLKHNNQD